MMRYLVIRTILMGGILFLFCYFSFHAISTVPFEFDSIIYHIPLAKSVLNGQILHPDKLIFPNNAFPASTELILALMMVFHIPLNMFNIIAWVLFGYLLYLLGTHFNLKNNTLIFCFSILTLPVVVRLFLTQTADIWLTVFFVWTWYLFLKTEKGSWHFFQLGLSAGLLIGAKLSGPLFFIGLLLIYGKNMLSHISFRRIVFFLIPFFLFGLSWYIRNTLIFSNPFYPATFLWMKGSLAYSPDTAFSHFRMITTVQNGLLYMVNALLSEYLFWPFILIIGLCFTEKSHMIKRVFNEEISLFILGIIGIVIYLAIPGNEYNYDNYVSEVRYSIPVIISFVLLFFVHVRKMSLSTYLPLFIFFNFIAIGTLFFIGGYHPKIIVVIGIVSFFFMTLPYLKGSLQQSKS